MNIEEVKKILEKAKKDGVIADLRSADLSSANLRFANLSSANLRFADLSSANLSFANLSQSKGFLKAREWIAENFKKTRKGFVVYKKIGNTTYDKPKSWNIKVGEFLEDVVNLHPTNDCGCGVNFGTREWCENNYSDADLWECLILFEDACDIVVPYNTDGKARCGRLQLVKMIKKG